ncbi:unnamed protein product [Paramecium pentaurelia]|uniref:Tetratricopeptide repeat protein n=1 Tax=Paramecium pentaurelia TaxID=43138 RepID=A0A8S1V454_9CILI|nr:unnamed protein product [Paramecium pentaurelia]
MLRTSQCKNRSPIKKTKKKNTKKLKGQIISLTKNIWNGQIKLNKKNSQFRSISYIQTCFYKSRGKSYFMKLIDYISCKRIIFYFIYFQDKYWLRNSFIKVLDNQRQFKIEKKIKIQFWVFAINTNSIIYSNDKQYDEAIKILDKALSFNTKHQLSLYSKADSLKMLGQYNEAIIWADKALQINPKDCFSLRTKGDSLRLLKDYKEALKVIDQSLSINPNHLSSLQSKGHCLQNQNNYQEALLFYEKALKIDSNHQWTKNRKDECLKALNTK